MPRLRAGQTAESVRSLAEKNRFSALARLEQLESFLQGDHRNAEHFRSFERLSAWHDPQLGIYRMTPKTLRGHINHCFEGGQDRLLSLLPGARNRAKTTGHAPHGKQSASDRAGAVMEMTGRYLDLLERLKRLASTSDTAAQELKHHLRLHGASKPQLHLVK
jgi:hypothetical protein